MFKHIIFLLVLYAILNINWVHARRFRRVTPSDQVELEKAQRNAECCAKNMRCCVRLQPPPIEIRAVYTRCPSLGGGEIKSHAPRTMHQPVLPANEFSIKNFQGFDEDEPLIQSRVTDCRSKIIMTMKLHHKGAIVCKSQYIVVDHVYDPLTDKSVRLLNPYVIRLRQEPVSKSFYLKFIDYVNSEAHEEVYNKQDANYTGCYISGHRSTCGQVRFDGKVIPYSEGFCCSCDSKKNLQRQPDSQNEKNEEIVSYSDPAFLLDRVGCPRNYYSDIGQAQLINGDEVINITTVSPETADCLKKMTPQCPATAEPKKRADLLKNRWKYTTYTSHATKKDTTTYRPSYLKRDLNNADHVDDSEPKAYLKTMSKVASKKNDKQQYMNDIKKAHNSAGYLNPLEEEARNEFTTRLARKMRQTFPSGVQKRGGQNCADRYTPPGMDPEHYHESAHCLRFSDVWYGIYSLGSPSIEQVVYINVYERFESQSKSDKWREVTNGTIRLGNRFTHYEDDLPSIAMTFNSKTLTDYQNYDNWEEKRILIPEGVRSCEIHKYPEMRGGPDEYLVVNANQIAIEGEQCDKVGVGFEAFFKQPQRCGSPRGTCLHNQPKHMWRNDKHLELQNKLGCYFLKYHANITSQPLYVNETTGEKFLFVEYDGAHLTTIDIEIKADQNSVIRDIAAAVITEVYVDSTCGKYTLMIIKVINNGLVSSKFMVQLTDFPLELPEYFSKIRSKLVLIAPQTLHIFTLEIKAQLPSDLMYCSVEVLNKKNELVALRRVRIQKFDRCICAWYCLCACVASVTGLKCNPMSVDHYHAAGFEGSLPIVTYLVHFTMLDDLLSVAFYFILFLLGLLLLMGLFKALIGMCCMPIGVWGLTVVLDLPKPMKKYYEKDLQKEKVIYDESGWPVHPKTYKPARNISIATSFCCNLVFFYTYPLACTIVIFKRLCCPYYTRRPCAGIADKQKTEKHPGQEGQRKKKCYVCGKSPCKSKCSRKEKKDKRCKKSKCIDADTCNQSRKDVSSTTNVSTASNRNQMGRKSTVAAYTHTKYKSPFTKPESPTHKHKSKNTLKSTSTSSFSPAKIPMTEHEMNVTFGRTILPNKLHDVEPVTTSSDYEESTGRSPTITPRTPKDEKSVSQHSLEPSPPASSSSQTSEGSRSNANTSQTGTALTSTTDTPVGESIAIQTRNDIPSEDDIPAQALGVPSKCRPKSS